MMKPIARDILREEEVHGGIDPAELEALGLSPESVLDFSANLNPFGPAPGIRDAVREAVIEHYPDRACRRLCEALARRHQVSAAQVLVGNGSVELIWLAAVAYLREGDRVAILGPAFGSYERASRMMGAAVTVCRAVAENDFCPPLDVFSQTIGDRRARLAFLATPNNPTGQLVSPARLRLLAARHPETLFVVDEAYADFADPFVGRESDWPENVLRLRSMTKAHALAGLRLGYAVGSVEVIAALRAVQPPWSVNAVAQAAGLAALVDEAYIHDSATRLNVAKAELVEQLRAAGFAPVPSVAPFFLLPVGGAACLRSLLLHRRILVRDCTSFGLPCHVRISSRGREDNARLVHALTELRTEVGA